MALTPNTDQAFLREVDEELRRDQVIAFWRRYGRWVIVGVVVGLALFAGWLVWRQSGVNSAGAQGESYQQAIRALADNDAAKADTLLKTLSQSDRDGYRASAMFTRGDVMIQRGDTRGAAALFGQIADDTGLPEPFRQLAVVRQTALELDGMRPSQVIARLRPLAVKGGPYFGSAGEMTAMAYLRLGQRARAGQIFGELASTPTVPSSIRQRAVQMAGLLGVDAIAQTQGAPRQ